MILSKFTADFAFEASFLPITELLIGWLASTLNFRIFVLSASALNITLGENHRTQR
jgi:hypothetical protein